MKQLSHSLFRIFGGLAVALCIVAAASPGTAQEWEDSAPDAAEDSAPDESDDSSESDESDESDPDAPATEAEEVRQRQRALEEREQIRDSTRRQLEAGQSAVHIYQLAEEMIDEVIADISELNQQPLAPAALRQMNLTPNLSDQFGEFIESTLVTALANHTDVAVRRCIACNAMRSRVEEDDWVMSRGLVEQDDLAREAERIGANTFLDARFSYYPGANIVAMQVEFFRADDGAVIWSETYRSDSTTAAILRTGDRVESRDERVEELERRIDERPYYGHQLTGGFGYIPYDSPEGGLGGMMLGYRLYEKFGSELQYLYGLSAEGFANFGEGNEIMGAFVSGTLQAEIFSPNLHDPTFRTGPFIGGFFAGTEGNSFVGGWGIDAILQYRLGAGASLFYFLPTEFAGSDLGGFGLKGRISFNW